MKQFFFFFFLPSLTSLCWCSSDGTWIHDEHYRFLNIKSAINGRAVNNVVDYHLLFFPPFINTCVMFRFGRYWLCGSFPPPSGFLYNISWSDRLEYNYWPLLMEYHHILVMFMGKSFWPVIAESIHPIKIKLLIDYGWNLKQ